MFAIYIDTSILGTGFAICEMGENKYTIIKTCCNFERNESSVKLSDFVSQSLESEQLLLSDLSALVVSIGPGSYTGVRVGLAWALGMSLPQKEKITSVGVSSFKLASKFLQLSSLKKTYLFLANTHSNGFMSCASDNGIDQVSLVSSVNDSQLLARLKQDKDAKVYVDESWQKIREVFDQAKIKYICVKRSWIAKTSFQSMLTCLDKKQIVHGDEAPLQPLYMKEWSLTKR